jgi:hypothetical protein
MAGRITVTNRSLGTEAKVNVPPDGIIGDRTRRRVWDRLGTPPGFPGAGPLGEEGEQLPPETPGWRYEFTDLGDGRVRAVPHRVQEAAG